MVVTDIKFKKNFFLSYILTPRRGVTASLILSSLMSLLFYKYKQRWRMYIWRKHWKKLNILRHSERELILKKEQQIAVENLLSGRDVLAVLPTGFGKSMIFTMYLLAKLEFEKQAISDTTVCIVVISPLTSIICDQIAEMESLGFTAVELTNETLKSILLHKLQFIYCSAENATSQSFLEALRAQALQTRSDVSADFLGRNPNQSIIPAKFL